MKTNLELSDYCESKVGLGYWLGTFGHFGTEAYLQVLAHSSWIGSEYTSDYQRRCRRWLGVQVFDCVGLIKGFVWGCQNNWEAESGKTAFYIPAQDVSADGIYDKANEKGNISSIPMVKGVLVHKHQHVGVYVGNDTVVEAKGADYGVIRSKFSSGNWERWSKCPWIDYSGEVAVEPVVLTVDSGVTYKVRKSWENAASQVGSYSVLNNAINAAKTVNYIVYTNTGVQIFPVVEEKASCPYAEPISLILKGSKGDSVRWVQWNLINKSYSLVKFGIDGDFGGETDVAVRKFQGDNNLVIDGIVGKITIGKLKE